MKNYSPTLRGPFTHENLAIFLIQRNGECRSPSYRVLEEALRSGEVLVHETGTVGQLEVENLSHDSDLFIQAGDVVKGGRQDRTLGVDFILPPSSGRVPIPAFCVESGRWQKRRAEDERHFSSSGSSLHRKQARLAAKLAQNQGAVWSAIAESQEALSVTLGKSIHAKASPTSYQLSVEDADLQQRKATFEKALRDIVPSEDDSSVGYAFYVDGERNTADLYGSPELFRKLWPKLLDVAVLEALSSRPGGKKKRHPTIKQADAWLATHANGELRDDRQVPPRVRVLTRVHPDNVVFETFDNSFAGEAVHVNIVAR